MAKGRQKKQENLNRPQKQKEPSKIFFYQYMKKDQSLLKKVQSNNSSEKPLLICYSKKNNNPLLKSFSRRTPRLNKFARLFIK